MDHPSTRDDRYTAGYAEAKAEITRTLAMVLRCSNVMGHPVTGEKISDDMVREIFALTFGTKALIDEFGPEPTGDIDLQRIMEEWTREQGG